MAFDLVCKNCETVTKVKNIVVQYDGKAHPESAMTVEYRVTASLNGNQSVLFSSGDYKSAEKFCWEQSCPFELGIEKKWIKRRNGPSIPQE